MIQKKSTRLTAFLLSLALLVSVLFLFSSCAKTTKDIAIIYTNDIHAGAEDNLGLATVAALKKDMIAEGYDTLLVDSGDLIQGSMFGTISKGKDMMNLLDSCGYDIATLGNHDFDFGAGNILTLAKETKCEYV